MSFQTISVSTMHGEIHGFRITAFTRQKIEFVKLNLGLEIKCFLNKTNRQQFPNAVFIILTSFLTLYWHKVFETKLLH